MAVEENRDNRQQGRSGERKCVPVDKQDFWEGRAQEFSKYAASTGYPEAFIKIMKIHKYWTVLDMACGGGTLTIPLAPKVKSVTAADFSPNMLRIVERRCREGKINNVKTVQARWEDGWESLGIGQYDVVVASRSLIPDDVTGCIKKLERAAKRAIYISTIVGTGPFDKELYESTGRQFNIGLDYIHYYNLLYEMGIRANVAFIPEDHRDRWDTQEDAFEDQRWMFHGGMTQEDEKMVRTYLKKHLIPLNGQWRLPYTRKCHWAVMWWNKGMEGNRP